MWCVFVQLQLRWLRVWWVAASCCSTSLWRQCPTGNILVHTWLTWTCSWAWWPSQGCIGRLDWKPTRGRKRLNIFCYSGKYFDTVGWAARRASGPKKNMGGWWRWALISPDAVAPSRMVSVSASVNLPVHHKVQKFSSGTGSPGWSRKRVVKRLWWLGKYKSTQEMGQRQARVAGVKEVTYLLLDIINMLLSRDMYYSCKPLWDCGSQWSSHSVPACMLWEMPRLNRLAVAVVFITTATVILGVDCTWDSKMSIVLSNNKN